MEPITTITTGWTIVKTAAEICNKLNEFGKSLKDRDARHKVDEILDQVRELKQSASELEDENRGLREKLRFNSDEYEFRSPFYYHKSKPDLPLCPKCFANKVAAPVAGPSQYGNNAFRYCLVCQGSFEVGGHKAPEPGSWFPRGL